MHTYYEGPRPQPKQKPMKLGNITVIRKERTNVSTLGDMYINGEFFCYTLEDYDRDHNRDGDLDDAGEEKVYGLTAIPSGTYEVILSMSKRFKRILPEILRVKGFVGIRIHRGNWAKNSSGCILVGYTKGPDFVGESRICEKDLIKKLEEFDKIEVEIK